MLPHRRAMVRENMLQKMAAMQVQILAARAAAAEARVRAAGGNEADVVAARRNAFIQHGQRAFQRAAEPAVAAAAAAELAAEPAARRRSGLLGLYNRLSKKAGRSWKKFRAQ
jgi:hypothetical protein